MKRRLLAVVNSRGSMGGSYVWLEEFCANMPRLGWEVLIGWTRCPGIPPGSVVERVKAP